MPQQLFSGDVSIYHFLGRGVDSNAYLITSHGESLIVDSGLCAPIMGGPSSLKELEQIVNQFSVTRLILTHSHIDHCGGAALLTEKGVDLTLIAHNKEAEVLENWEASYIDPFFSTKMNPLKIDEHVEDGDTIRVGDVVLEVLNTPGHTEGSICLWCGDSDKNWLFSGDTVFTHGSFGRTDLKTGSSADLVQSIDRLLKLPVQSLFPGHERPVLENGREHIAMARNYASAMWSFL